MRPNIVHTHARALAILQGPYDVENLTEPPVSTDVLGAVCKELRAVDSVPVLVAVDNFNAYYNATELYGAFRCLELAFVLVCLRRLCLCFCILADRRAICCA